MRQHLLVCLFAPLAVVACGKSSSSGGSTPVDSTGEELVVKGNALATPNLVQKMTAATPAGFKTTSSLTLAQASDICNTTFPEVSGVRPDGYYSCLAAYDMRDQFFQKGPVVISNRLASVDQRLNEYVSRLANFEIPCMDETNTAERTASVLVNATTRETQTIPAFALKEFDTATTYSDSHVLDFGKKYSFNCSDTFTSNGYDFNILLGQKSGTWNLAEIQTASGAAVPEMKTIMSLDAEENLEILFGIGGIAESSGSNPETGAYTTLKSGLYNETVGFTQFIVRPQENIVGASSVLNNGCERRLVMNDKAVYVEVNGNNYGNCYASDIWTADSGYTGRAFSTAAVTAKGCLKVSGTTPEPQADLTLCEQSGLLVANEAGTAYEDPFIRYGIFKFGTNIASPPTGGLALRAYHGGRFAPTLGAGTNKLQLIEIPVDATVEVEGYIKSSFAFAKSTSSSDSDAGKVTAACNAAAASREVTYTQKSEFPIKTWVDLLVALPPTKDPYGKDVSNTEESAVAQLNAVFAYTGSEAPVVSTKIFRSVGASYKAVGSGTVTLKYNDTTVGTATVDTSTLAADKAVGDVKIAFTTIPVVDGAGKFTLEFSGKTVLECNSSNATTRTVNTHLGLGSLTFYTLKDPPAVQ